MKIVLVAGTRPNFMKIAALLRSIPKGMDCSLVHTGQHYDKNMSEVFFDELSIKKPDYNLYAGGGSHGTIIGKIMTRFEKVLAKESPDLVVVVGDVDSTLACALSAKHMQIEVAHVEAGLRSFDDKMPEEVNRRLTDAISDYLFCTEQAAVSNLIREGHDPDLISLVGDTMIDTLLYQNSKLNGATFDHLAAKEDYLFMTLHRPSNVDNVETLQPIVEAINIIARDKDIPVFWPVHPRTSKMLDQDFVIWNQNIILLPPLSYIDSLILWRSSKCVLTDSGSLQNETSALGVPCVTIRDNTERPQSVKEGTNVLAGVTKEGILQGYEYALEKKGRRIFGHDGKASERIWELICREAC